MVFDEPGQIKEGWYAMTDPIVELRHVSKAFGSIYALRDVSLAINAREIVSLLGDNGAGKSTLTKIISGVHAPDGGEIFIKGQKVTHWNSARARRMGIETVYQDKALAEHQDVTRNIFMGREITTWLGFLNGRKQRQEAEALMRRIGFTSRVMSAHSIVASLSGGEREGVAIARALFFKADLIILDEPTTALSLTQSQEVLKFVERARQEGAAVLFISHNIFHAHQVADRIVIVDRGSVAAELRKEELTAVELTELMQDVARGKEILAHRNISASPEVLQGEVDQASTPAPGDRRYPA
jgi:simple sugar transport system ATP-binding protein